MLYMWILAFNPLNLEAAYKPKLMKVTKFLHCILVEYTQNMAPALKYLKKSGKKVSSARNEEKEKIT